MTTPLPPLEPDAITNVLLADGIWHPVAAGTLLLYYNPQFATVPGEPPLTVGGLWVQLTDTSGVTYGAPIGEVKAVQWVPQQGQ